ncbi:hypothetical protein C8A00DRAFT_10859 [Chaetomidium leptoderma]|uniref:Uncharacterized protein n=1 Tax=Chaetomidium leptoderma TaxID=669021 RepID=A0AAN6VY93_9PEZI|nr:hypothetical protein C8A00DRAFT_10859 [Chaetomidium leptoderma]
MAKDRDSDALGANQSKNLDLADQPQQQHPPQQPHRAKSQKHVVGGAAGGRLHKRVPSSKGLQKHHASASTTKLNRKHGSLSPDRGGGVGAALASHHHRRATSELRLTHDPSSTNLKKNTSQTNLKRNRSQVEVGKRTKSTTTLQRAASSPAVNKLRSSGSSKVQFNLGDEGRDEDNDEDQDDDDEWVDASSSASPLLSRRGSAVSSAHTNNPPADDEDSPEGSPTPHAELQRQLGHGIQSETQDTGTQNGAQNGAQNGTRGGTRSGAQNGTTTGAQNGAHSPPRNKPSHNQYLASRILSRTSWHGAPPMMSAETASARLSPRQQSPASSSLGQSQYLPNTPGITPQARPGSSGKAELTSRFVGNNSHEPGSGIGGESFILAADRAGLSRPVSSGRDALTMPKRRLSSGALSQARGIDVLNARQAAAEGNISDDDDDDERTTRVSRRSRRSGEYVVPREMNRTQQKLNLQRASSSLEPAHTHSGMGIGPPGVAAGAGPLIGVPSTYDSRDPRISKTLERTGMEYLTVRRHLNPVARSISRVMQLPGLENSRRIPQPPGVSSSRHASRLSEQFNPHHHHHQREPITRNSSMADLINGGGHHSSSGRRPPTPRSTGGGGGGAFSALQSGASSSLGTEDDDDDDHDHDDGAGASRRMHERQGPGPGQQHHHHHHGQLSGTSLVDGAEDAGTVALLRMMWDKNMDLGASQD